MDKGLLFWVLFVIWVLVGGAWLYSPTSVGRFGPYGNGLLLVFLVFILGWANFGFVVR